MRSPAAGLIVDGGGWQHDTLTEDLDLSYRAQLKGWRFVFMEDVIAPAELPVEMNSFKSQQFRWAKGSVQTALKLLPRGTWARRGAAVALVAALGLAVSIGLPMLWSFAVSAGAIAYLALVKRRR